MDRKIGVLGGGQLGKMLALSAHTFGLPLWILDKQESYPAGPVASHFVEGDFSVYEDVIRFGESLDVLTIEIENVNTDALRELEALGKRIYPQPAVIERIKDKGTQKTFYTDMGIPTAPYVLVDNREEIRDLLAEGTWTYPFVWKARTQGYDGRGVSFIRDSEALSKCSSVPSVIERAVDIKKEIAVIVARSTTGDMQTYEPVEMCFHPEANMLDYQLCPARLSAEERQAAIDLSVRTAEAYAIVGILAVELFLDHSDHWYVNEVAPRPHNSGHHTIEASEVSQYEQLIRILAGWPMAQPIMRMPSVLCNLVGEAGYKGDAHYQGLIDCLALPGVHVHLYGKKESRPFRKMGHVTITARDLDRALEKANFVRETLKVIA